MDTQRDWLRKLRLWYLQSSQSVCFRSLVGALVSRWWTSSLLWCSVADTDVRCSGRGVNDYQLSPSSTVATGLSQENTDSVLAAIEEVTFRLVEISWWTNPTHSFSFHIHICFLGPRHKQSGLKQQECVVWWFRILKDSEISRRQGRFPCETRRGAFPCLSPSFTGLPWWLKTHRNCESTKRCVLIFFLNILFIYFTAPGLSCRMWILRCSIRDLVHWPGIQPRLPALGAQSLIHWTTRQVSAFLFYHPLSDLLTAFRFSPCSSSPSSVPLGQNSSSPSRNQLYATALLKTKQNKDLSIGWLSYYLQSGFQIPYPASLFVFTQARWVLCPGLSFSGARDSLCSLRCHLRAYPSSLAEIPFLPGSLPWSAWPETTSAAAVSHLLWSRLTLHVTSWAWSSMHELPHQFVGLFRLPRWLRR